MKDWFLLRDHVPYCTNPQCLSVFRCICLCVFVGTDDLRSEDELGVRMLAACAAKCTGRSISI